MSDPSSTTSRYKVKLKIHKLLYHLNWFFIPVLAGIKNLPKQLLFMTIRRLLEDIFDIVTDEMLNCALPEESFFCLKKGLLQLWKQSFYYCKSVVRVLLLSYTHTTFILYVNIIPQKLKGQGLCHLSARLHKNWSCLNTLQFVSVTTGRQCRQQREQMGK